MATGTDSRARRYRTAVIGCGRMGAVGSESVRRFAPACWNPLSHAESVRAHARLDLVALCDEDDARLSHARKLFGGVPGVNDYRHLRAFAPEIVTVATRTPGRADVLAWLAEAGVRGLHVEKPLCNSVTELRALEQLLSRADVPCTYGTLRRYMPVYALARELAWSGAFGDVVQIHVRMGRGTLLWTHPHSLDLLLFFANDDNVHSVSARFNAATFVSAGARIDCDPEVVQIGIEFAAGTTGLISQQGNCDVEVACTRGQIICEADGRRIRVRTAGDGDPYWDHSYVEPVPDVSRGGTYAALERLIEAVESTAPERDYGRRIMFRGQELLFAACQSHLLNGAATAPAQIDPDIVVTGRDGARYA